MFDLPLAVRQKDPGLRVIWVFAYHPKKVNKMLSREEIMSTSIANLLERIESALPSPSREIMQVNSKFSLYLTGALLLGTVRMHAYRVDTVQTKLKNSVERIDGFSSEFARDADRISPLSFDTPPIDSLLLSSEYELQPPPMMDDFPSNEIMGDDVQQPEEVDENGQLKINPGDAKKRAIRKRKPVDNDDDSEAIEIEKVRRRRKKAAANVQFVAAHDDITLRDVAEPAQGALEQDLNDLPPLDAAAFDGIEVARLGSRGSNVVSGVEVDTPPVLFDDVHDFNDLPPLDNIAPDGVEVARFASGASALFTNTDIQVSVLMDDVIAVPDTSHFGDGQVQFGPAREKGAVEGIDTIQGLARFHNSESQENVHEAHVPFDFPQPDTDLNRGTSQFYVAEPEVVASSVAATAQDYDKGTARFYISEVEENVQQAIVHTDVAPLDQEIEQGSLPFEVPQMDQDFGEVPPSTQIEEQAPPSTQIEEPGRITIQQALLSLNDIDADPTAMSVYRNDETCESDAQIFFAYTANAASHEANLKYREGRVREAVQGLIDNNDRVRELFALEMAEAELFGHDAEFFEIPRRAPSVVDRMLSPPLVDNLVDDVIDNFSAAVHIADNVEGVREPSPVTGQQRDEIVVDETVARPSTPAGDVRQITPAPVASRQTTPAPAEHSQATPLKEGDVAPAPARFESPPPVYNEPEQFNDQTNFPDFAPIVEVSEAVHEEQPEDARIPEALLPENRAVEFMDLTGYVKPVPLEGVEAFILSPPRMYPKSFLEKPNKLKMLPYKECKITPDELYLFIIVRVVEEKKFVFSYNKLADGWSRSFIASNFLNLLFLHAHGKVFLSGDVENKFMVLPTLEFQTKHAHFVRNVGKVAV